MTGEARSERKANTDPGLQRNRIKQISQAKAQKYAAGMPEEESSATSSLRLPTSSLRPNKIPSFQLQIHARADQNWSDTQSEVYLPYQSLSNMIPDFRHVLKNIADDITEISTLVFMCDMNLMDTKQEKLTALEILWKQCQKGIFAHDNIEPLERLLKDIDRCDLASKYVEPYKQKYGKHTTSKGKSGNT